MPSVTMHRTPGLTSFLKGLSTDPVETSIQKFVNHLRRHEIKGSKACAIATAKLLRRVISSTRASDPSKLIQRVHDVGKTLVAAQPRELAVGNIVRRVLGLIRDEEDESRADGDMSSSWSSEAGSEPQTPRIEALPLLSNASLHGNSPRRDQSSNRSPTRPPLLTSHTGMAGGRPVTSMFSILSHPTMKTSGNNSPAMRSGTGTPTHNVAASNTDLRAEIIEGISEIIDELEQSDEQIASYATEHIHNSEIIFTYSSSLTVQRFLLKAASKRKFTVIHAEAYPNNHTRTHTLVTGNIDPEDDEMAADSFQKPLTAVGITVILIPDSAIFALMARANKVILGAHAVLSNGSLIASAGTKMITLAAKHHRVPVVVLAGTYKLCPKYPYDPDVFMEDGDGSNNPVFDFVESGVDVFVTNLGGVAAGVVYRVVREQYRDEDLEL